MVRAPVLANPGSQSNAQGDTVSLQLSGTQPDGDSILYDASDLPPGLDIDPSSGLISGTIAEGAASGGPYQVTVSAYDQTSGKSAA